jgi:preprotein translocase subunit SecB
MVSILGPTLLLGSAREFIYNLTSRGPYPSVYLPTVSFLPLAAQKSKGAAISKEKKAASKSKRTLSQKKVD